MKEIPLTQGMVALVDDEDYKTLMKWKWYCTGFSQCSHKLYAVRNETLPSGKQSKVRMHNIILNSPYGFEVDHINGNGLDNRKENLRIATRAQNQYNRGKQENNTSGFKGVYYHNNTTEKTWTAQIKISGKNIHLGYFKDKTEAARVYNAAAIKHHGEFALLNQVDI